MEEFQFSKFKGLCQKDLLEYLDSAFTKVETESEGHPEIVDTFRNASPGAFVFKQLSGIFYDKFHEIEKENLRLRSMKCEKCSNLMAELRISSSNVNKLTNRCAYLFSRLSLEVQKELGNNWAPLNLPLENDPNVASPVMVKTVAIDASNLTLPKRQETPTRTPLTPVKSNSPSMLSPSELVLSPLAFRKEKTNRFENQENTCFPREMVLSSPTRLPMSSPIRLRWSPQYVNLKNKVNNNLSKTPSPKKNRKGGIKSSCSSRGIENTVRTSKKLDESDTELNTEDVLQPTPPSTWIKPHTPKGNRSTRFRNKDSKKLKQQTLTSMSKNFPKATVDVTTLKEFRGGYRSTVPAVENTYPAKRKSDEMNVESPNGLTTEKIIYTEPTLEDLDLDLTVFDPIPISVIDKKELSNFIPTEVKNANTMKSFGNMPNPQSAVSSSTNTRQKFTFKAKSTDKKDLNSTEDIIKDFDKIPERAQPDEFGKPIRRKDERAKLSGWTCDQCRKYYEGLESQMHPSELQRIKNDCSRHRSNRPLDLNETPVEFWVNNLPSTEEAYAHGYIKIGTASPSVPKRRHDLLDDDN